VRTRGQSVVEFALMLPLLVVLFASVLDLGRIAFAQVAITNAAREGAFQAAVTPTSYTAGQPCPSDGLSNLVVCRTILETKGSTISIAPSDIQLECVPSDCSTGIGNNVTVRVSAVFHLLTPILAAFFGGSRDLMLSASSTAQIASLPTPTFSAPWATPSPSPDPSASASPSPSAATCTLPSAGFTFNASPSNMKAPVMLSVTDTSTNGGCTISNWTWDWGDGTVSYGANPLSHPYSSPGTYNVTLTVANTAGSNTTGAVVIKVKP
jgi:hypothetical protein